MYKVSTDYSDCFSLAKQSVLRKSTNDHIGIINNTVKD